MSEVQTEHSYGQSIEEVVRDGKWQRVRKIRDAKLKSSDWVVIKSQELGSGVNELWVEYRQALRDITSNHSDPDAVVWPSAPED